MDLVDSNGVAYNETKKLEDSEKAFLAWSENNLDVSAKAAWIHQDESVKQWYSVAVALRAKVQEIKGFAEETLSMMNEVETNNMTAMLDIMELLTNGMSCMDTGNMEGITQFRVNAKAKINAIKDTYLNGQENNSSRTSK